MPSTEVDIASEFERIFGPGGRIHRVRAPGRVNLIGEHTDYNDGFVFPMAIEPEVRLLCRARDDERVRLASTAYEGAIVEYSLREKIAPAEPAWANYSRGVTAELLAAGIPLVGMDALISNTLPVGGGLSSSAALEVATARALAAVAGQDDVDPDRLALLCQKAEHDYAGVPVGIMDQMIVLSAREAHAMLLDCRDLSRQFVPIDPEELRVVIVNSMVAHELAGGEYAVRRRQCEEGVRFFQRENPAIKALRDVTMQQIEAADGKLDQTVWRRCRHVVSENARTVEAAELLRQREYERMGKRIVQSHESLRDDYEVTVPELDFLVAEAMNLKGVYGARMTGGGFGGCIVALVQPRAVESLVGHLHRSYTQRFGRAPEAYVTTATAGAGVLE